MITHTTNYLEVIQYLPAGGTLILTEVPWEDYEQLLNDLGDCSSLRISYNQGRMEIMSPSHQHEYFKDVVFCLALTLAQETSSTFQSFGSATHKQKWLARGVEPDVCFYIQNAALIIGKDQIDLRTDPPPDVVVEIDVSHDSIAKLAIYAGKKVPEIWRYEGKRAQMLQLVGDQYVEIAASIAFPLLTSDALTQFLEQSKTEGQSATVKSFRKWLRTQSPSG